MRCIFCLNESPPSKEHVFPSAIGGTWIIDRVCKVCNDRLGHDVDKLLSEHFLTLSRMYSFSVGNKTEVLSKIFKNFKGAHFPERPELKMQMMVDKSDGRLRSIIRYSRLEEELEGGGRRVQIVMGDASRDEIRKILQREIARGADFELPEGGA